MMGSVPINPAYKDCIWLILNDTLLHTQTHTHTQFKNPLKMKRDEKEWKALLPLYHLLHYTYNPFSITPFLVCKMKHTSFVHSPNPVGTNHVEFNLHGHIPQPWYFSNYLFFIIITKTFHTDMMDTYTWDGTFKMVSIPVAVIFNLRY